MVVSSKLRHSSISSSKDNLDYSLKLFSSSNIFVFCIPRGHTAARGHIKIFYNKGWTACLLDRKHSSQSLPLNKEANIFSIYNLSGIVCRLLNISHTSIWYPTFSVQFGNLQKAMTVCSAFRHLFLRFYPFSKRNFRSLSIWNQTIDYKSITARL